MASGVSLHHLSYAVILWPALLQFAKVGLTLTVAAWVFGVFPSFETVFWLLAAAVRPQLPCGPLDSWASLGPSLSAVNPLPRVISLSAVFLQASHFRLRSCLLGCRILVFCTLSSMA